MQPASLDLALERGDDARVTFRFRDAAGAPIVLEPGEITLELSWPGGGVVLEEGDGLALDGAAGEAVWEATPDQLTGAPPGRITTLRLVRTNAADGRRSYAVGLLTLTDGPAPGDQTVTLTVQALTIEVEVTAGGGGGGGIADIAGLQDALDARAMGVDLVAEEAAREAVDAALDSRLDTAEAKLSGIEPGATANASNAALRDRATHTGAQAISTVTGLQTALDGKQAADADLAALAGAATSGLWTRTGSGTGTTRTLTGTANEITVSNGDGVAGNPAISLPTAMSFTGKTVTGGTFASPMLTTPNVTGRLSLTDTTYGNVVLAGIVAVEGVEFLYNGGEGYLNVVDRTSGIVGKPLSIVASVVKPYFDNVASLGGSSNRWSVVYAGTGTINTSDRDEKAPAAPELIEPATGFLTSLGLRVAARIPIRAFQWLSSIALKGQAARIHFGWYAQDWQEAFEAEGLDPARYGLWCRDEVIDAETGLLTTRLGLRPDQCLAFLLAAHATRLSALEA